MNAIALATQFVPMLDEVYKNEDKMNSRTFHKQIFVF